MPSQTNTVQLADSAQQQLAVLREALESRLATLEDVLADPSRGESLAGLILDLSRIATEEAQAAAAQACLAIRAEADKEISELRTSAKTAVEAAQTALRTTNASLEQERAVGADLRRVADQAHQEIQKQTELLAAREKLETTLKSGREQLESEVARHEDDRGRPPAHDRGRAEAARNRTCLGAQGSDKVAAELTHVRETLSGRERAQAELQSAFDAERAAVADARGAIELAETRVAMLEDEQEVARAAREAIVADALREAATRNRAYAELQERLEAEHTAAAELHAQLQAERASAAELHLQIDAERAAATELHSRLEVERESGTALQLQLETERAAAAELRLAAGRATERVTELGATLGRETSEGKAAHEELSSELTRQRDLAALLQTELADGHLALAAVRTELEIERTSSAGLRQAVEAAEQQLATARSNETQALANHERVMAELDQLRADAASAAAQGAGGPGGSGDAWDAVQRELGAERDNLRVERASNADLRQALEFADHQLAGARSSETQTLADHVQLAAELDKLHAELDADRARLDALTAERDAVAEELAATRKWIDDLHEAEAEFASSPAAAPDSTLALHRPCTRRRHPKTKWTTARHGRPCASPPGMCSAKKSSCRSTATRASCSTCQITGCQLLSPTALKPNHTVKVTLPDGKKPVICTGTVVWTRLEPSGGGQAIRYRAGVRFTKADEAAIETFASRHGATA